MGGRLSPALCGKVVALHGQCCEKTYRLLISNRKFSANGLHTSSTPAPVCTVIATRCVGNRPSLGSRRLASLPPFAQFCHPQLYGTTIILERETDCAVLGFEWF